MKQTCLLVVALGLLFASCRKSVKDEVNITGTPTDVIGNSSKTEFAQTLARALTNKEVRDLLRQEALKMFDKDYDVLYALSKDVTAPSGKTLHELVSAYATDKARFDQITGQLPTLTIYVPQLDQFDADKWNTSAQVPIVAVRNPEDKKSGKPLLAYDDKGNTTHLKYAVKPDVPVIVVKENERITTQSPGSFTNARSTNRTSAFLQKGGQAFSFIDDSYDGVTNATGRTNHVQGDPHDPRDNRPLSMDIDSLALRAYEKKITPQRDYIYYDIDPTRGKDTGELRNDYGEFITAITVNEYSSKDRIVDDFTDGMLEFQVTVFFLSREGAGGTLMKSFPCDPAKLFPKPRVVMGETRYWTETYVLSTPIPITPWDMRKYGDTWKVLVMEYDPGTETTYTSNVTSTFGWNFGLDLGFEIEKVKVGLKFGINKTTAKSETFNIKVTGTSDNLGEGLLNFADPVVINRRMTPGLQYSYVADTYEVNTGTVKVSIEPRKRF
ncbi:MAG TPA: hypothetical protein VM802_07330 [Chitinophaga sp.]|uniref:hypothetical protein n=1 Tax=Chitinophaga sp. TaxID=1869181 RepID=UPI002B910D67|nr:hypothetical protein [Chitinophaga sp.]HVI44663.1 hypothetical protein [Chitinophaga sp.]